jgi:CubicO group peptidase (beta-lactamase class C family)
MMRAGMLVVSMIIIAHAVRAADPEPAKVDALFANIAPSSPGAAVVVIKDGRAVFQRGYGVTDLRTLHRIDEHTNFRLASVTKQFTALAVMLLVHDGKLRYDESLTEIFPEFPAYGKTITVRHLLNHTSGLLDYEDLMAKQYGNTPDDQIPQIHDAGVLMLLEKATTTNFPAGTRWQYSNSGYCVLAMVVEKVSGQPFAQFLHDRIFAPLQMKNTLAYVERRASPPAGRARTPVTPSNEKGKNEVPNRAYGHTPDGNGFRETDQSSTSATLGDGGVYTSLADMARWDDALQRHTLLSEKEMQPTLTAVHPTSTPAEENGHPVSYGFGWFIDPYRGHERMWHYGETVGFRTSIQRFPKDRLTVIVLANRADLSAIDLALKTADLYLDTK